MKKIIPEYIFTPEQDKIVRAIASECGLHEVTARILYARGVDTSDKVRRFLESSSTGSLPCAVRTDWSLYSATMMQTVSAPHPF